jgi:hypothetical protein
LNHWTCEGKVAPATNYHFIKVYVGHGGKSLSFLNLDTKPHTSVILLPRRQDYWSLQSWPGCDDNEKILTPAENLTPGVQPITN